MKALMKFLSMILITLNANAATYLIQSEQASDQQYLAHLKAGRQHKAFSEKQFENALAEAKNINLEKMFLNLQGKLRSNNAGSFINEYKDIYYLRHKHNWSKTQRGIIAKTILMLSGLELDPLRKRKLINEAKSFSSPLQFGKTRMRLTDRLTPEVLNNYQFASINGQRIDFDKKIKLGPEAIRIQLFSNKWQSHFETIELDHLKNIKPRLNPLVTGSCDLGFYPYKGFNKINNEQVVGHGCRSELATRPKAKDTSPNITDTFKKKDSFRVNKKWLLIGGAIIGGLFLINQDDDSGGPKRTSGF